MIPIRPYLNIITPSHVLSSFSSFFAIVSSEMVVKISFVAVDEVARAPDFCQSISNKGTPIHPPLMTESKETKQLYISRKTMQVLKRYSYSILPLDSCEMREHSRRML